MKINWRVVSETQRLSEKECDVMLKKVLEEPNCKLDIKELPPKFNISRKKEKRARIRDRPGKLSKNKYGEFS